MKKVILSAAVMALVSGGFAASANAAESSNVNTVVVAGDKWDKILDEYEQLVDQYIKLYKKAMAGDMSAMAEYAKLAEKAQKLSEKIENAGDDMSAAQMQRYAKITQKMSNALM